MDRPDTDHLYEEAILDMQLAFEETYIGRYADLSPNEGRCCCSDRGVMDIKAFMPPAEFAAMLRRKGLDEMTLRDRYHGVVHLVTAADGAIEYYSGENNGARLETAEEAAAIDRRIQESWLGHPRFKIIDNRTDFQSKIRRTFSAISRILGIPESIETKERYLVEHVDYEALPTHQIIEIEQTYLRTRDPDEIVRIKKRRQDSSFLYFLGRDQKGRGGHRGGGAADGAAVHEPAEARKPGTGPLSRTASAFSGTGSISNSTDTRERATASCFCTWSSFTGPGRSRRRGCRPSSPSGRRSPAPPAIPKRASLSGQGREDHKAGRGTRRRQIRYQYAQ
jgi:hypothetical protein